MNRGVLAPPKRCDDSPGESLKSSLFFLARCGVCFTLWVALVWAQTPAPNPLTVTNTGKVGIGTSTPGQTLEIYNGSTLANRGSLLFAKEPAPGPATLALDANPGSLTGAYSYQITFVTAAGETAAGAPSATINPANQGVDLTQIPTGTPGVVIARNLYRTKAGGNTYQFLATLADNTATTYTDNTPDTSLGALAPMYDHTSAIGNGTGNAPSDIIAAGPVVDVRAFGAKGDGLTDDATAIQAALDAVATRGGGAVYMPANVYLTTQPLIVSSRTHLYGDGIGASVIRHPAGQLTCKTVRGAFVCASIAMVAADHASVSNLTVDHQTNGADANGIIMISDGADGAGTPTTHSQIAGCEVLGYDTHQYLIWNQFGSYNKILNNHIDGGVAANNVNSSQDGIEVYGGTDILVQGNTLRNIGSTGIWTFSETGTAARIGVRFLGNYIDGARVGIGSYNLADAKHIQIKDNVVRNTWVTGISVTSSAGVNLSDIQISGNSVKNSVLQGIHLFATAGSTGSISGIVVANNVVDSISGDGGGYGIDILNYSNTLVSGNIVANTTVGVYAAGSTAVDITGNVIDKSSTYAVQADTSTLRIRENTLTNYNLSNGSFPGIYLTAANGGVVFNNHFLYAGSEPSAVSVDSASTKVHISGNDLLYTPALSAVFANAGTNPTGDLSYVPGIRLASGAASLPANLLSGSWFSGGTSATTKPQFLIEPAGTPSANWNMSGTGFGVNAGSGFTGNLLDLQNAGVSQMSVASNGAVSIAGNLPVSENGFNYIGAVTLGSPGTQGSSLFVNTPSLSASYNSGLSVDGSYNNGMSLIQLKARGVSSGGGYASNFSFSTDNNGVASEVLRLDQNGRVGIGITAPNYPLDIQAPSAEINLRKTVSSNGDFLQFQTPLGTVASFNRDANYGLTIKSSSAEPMGLWQTTPQPIVFQTNNAEAMRVDSTGFVGIGTSMPAYPLDLQAAGGEINIRKTVASTGDYLQFQTSLGTVASFNRDPTYGLTIKSSSAEPLGLWQAAAQPLIFRTNNTEAMRVDSTGNVGIGTAAPAAKLDVKGDRIIVETKHTPASSSESCVTGSLTWDSSYLYICTGTNAWKRAALASF